MVRLQLVHIKCKILDHDKMYFEHMASYATLSHAIQKTVFNFPKSQKIGSVWLLGTKSPDPEFLKLWLLGTKSLDPEF